MFFKVLDVSVYYGKAVAIMNISIEMDKGTVVCLVGANGAGKTTLLRAISGLTPIEDGEIWFNEQNLKGLSPLEIVKQGLVHIPQGRQLFPYLTVWSNLNLGASLRNDKDGIQSDMENVFEHFPILRERQNQKAGTLSGGEQEMLAIGRGLMANPKLILMDEPSLGLAPLMVQELVPVIQDINKRGVSVLLVEQNIPLALSVATKGYALQTGKIVLEGDIESFKNSKIIEDAYLGE